MRFELLHPADQLVMIMNRIYYYGMTTTSGGNLSIKDDNGDIWITPSGIDKGNPNSDYRKEPAGYNGRRVNLGYYGNTPWATMTQPVGSVYYLR